MISLVLYSVHTVSVTEKTEDCRLGQIDRNSRLLTNFEDFKWVFRGFMVLFRVLSSCLLFSVLYVLFKKNEPECRLAFLNLIIHYCECFKRLQRIRYT